MENTTTSSATTQALLITGNTFTSRRDLKALGGKWYPESEGWIIPLKQCEAAEKLAGGKNFIVEIIDVPAVALERPKGDRLRAIRQAKIDRKAERLRASLPGLRRKVDAVHAALEPYNDFAFWSEPIKIGHHSEKRHRNLRAKLERKMSKGAEVLREIEQRSQRVEHLENTTARIAGDAERQRQVEREALDKVISVGSVVHDFAFGTGTVVRVNKKTYSIRFASGSTYARDKTFVRPSAA